MFPHSLWRLLVWSVWAGSWGSEGKCDWLCSTDEGGLLWQEEPWKTKSSLFNTFEILLCACNQLKYVGHSTVFTTHYINSVLITSIPYVYVQHMYANAKQSTTYCTTKFHSAHNCRLQAVFFFLQLATCERALSSEASRCEKRRRQPKKKGAFFRAFPISLLQSRACVFSHVLFNRLRKKRDCS